MLLELVLTMAGILILLTSTLLLLLTLRIIRANTYSTLKWNLVLLLLLFFIIGYIYNLLTLLNDKLVLIAPLTMVAMVYFFGSIFTLITMYSIRTFTREVLGDYMNDEKALELFIQHTGVDPTLPALKQKFRVTCDKCQQSITYTFASIVKQHHTALEKGVQTVEVFGTTSYYLIPIHKCIDGRRGIPVVHDHNLELRSVEPSKLLFKSVV